MSYFGDKTVHQEMLEAVKGVKESFSLSSKELTVVVLHVLLALIDPGDMISEELRKARVMRFNSEQGSLKLYAVIETYYVEDYYRAESLMFLSEDLGKAETQARELTAIAKQEAKKDNETVEKFYDTVPVLLDTPLPDFISPNDHFQEGG